MNHLEQRIVTFSLAIVMTFLVAVYITSITVGLLTLQKDMSEEVETVYYHETKVVSKTLYKEPPIPVVHRKDKPKDNKELILLAKIINAEAGTEPYKGKLAVGNVIMNRIESPQFPDTIRDVVYQRGQFSPVTDGSINNKPSEDSLQAAKEVLNGRRILHKDVLFFYNPDISTSGWIFTREVVTTIGDHAFAL